MAVTRAEYELYRAALEGDFGPLIDMLRSGAELSSEVREVLAGILERKCKSPPHRVAKRATQARYVEIASRTRELARNMPMKVAVANVALEFNCGTRTVQSAVAKLRKKEEIEAQVEAQIRVKFVEILSKTHSPEEVEKILQYAESSGLIMQISSGT